jgi:hypothetical protein
MTDPAAATETQLRNITAATGKTVDDFAAALAPYGPLPHGKLVAVLKSDFGLTHGNANLIATKVRERAAGGPTPEGDLLGAQYAGAKAGLRPIHDRLVAAARGFGPDVSVVAQKTAVSLRRKKQFGVIQAASAKRVQLGLNLAATPSDPRITETTGMCSHRVDLTSPEAVDATVLTWLRTAYDEAG